MEWEGLLVQVIYLVIATFVPIIGIALRRAIMNNAILADLMAKEELVTKAVEFVEQFYHDYEGEEKYEFALTWASAQLEARGVKINAEELKGLIEAAVYELKAGWFE